MNTSSSRITAFVRKYGQYMLVVVLGITLCTGLIVGNFFSRSIGPDTQTAASVLATGGIPWHTDNGSTNGGVRAVGQILDVQLSYNADATPPISVTSFRRENGFVPRREATSDDYTFALLNPLGVVVKQVAFTIPNQISGPPPLEGTSDEAVTKSSTVTLRKLNFDVTIAWDPTATFVKIISPKGVVLVAQPIANIQTVQNTSHSQFIRGDEFLRSYSQSSLQSALDTILPGAGAASSGSVLDVVLIANGYAPTSLDKFHQDANNDIAKLLSIEPYKSRASQLVFHIIDNTQELNCPNYNCDGAKVIQAVNAAGVPWDKITVIENSSVYGGAACDPISVTYNGPLGPDVFVHETGGHTIGNLNDEYVFSSPQSPIINCTQHNPNDAWKDIVGTADYQVGCDYPTYYAPSSQSMMRDLSPYFNAVSQIAINAKLDYYAGPFADSVSPVISISAPQSGSTVNGRITVQVRATDNVGVGRVGLFVDGVLYKTAYQAPFSISWYTPGIADGSHTLQAKAYDARGNIGVSGLVTVIVANNSPVDTAAPKVSIATPAANATVSGKVSVIASASDNVGVTKVELYKDGKLFGSDAAAPYGFVWDTSGATGAHTLQAKAYDGEAISDLQRQ